jgi:uroporphyrinogen-III synthase
MARGIFVDLTPAVFSSAALGEALAAALPKNERVILPRSAIGGKEIINALGAARIDYIDIPIYNTVPETGYENAVLRAALIDGLDYIAFTSPSAVEGFVTIFGADAGISGTLSPNNAGAGAVCGAEDAPGQSSTGKLPPVALCIGEATAAPARSYGFDVIVPANATIEGMADALVRRVHNS